MKRLEMNNERDWMHIEEPDKGSKFIAIYNDDSGCIMCERTEDGTYWVDTNEEPYTVDDEWFDSCLRWVAYD